MTDLEFRRPTPSGRHPWAVNDRDHAARRARLEMACPDLLRVDVDFGLSVVQQVLEHRESTRPTVTAMAVALLFHRVVELVDAVDVLLTAGAALPAREMTRTLEDATLYVRWLAARDDESLAAAYLLTSNVETMRRSVRLDPEVEEKVNERLDRELAFIKSLGKDVDRRETINEVVRLYRERGEWYSAFGGPPSLSDLIRGLGDEPSGEFGFVLDDFGMTARSLDWAQSVILEGQEDPIPMGRLLHPLRDIRSYSDSIAFVCHGCFVAALEAIIEYVGGELDGLSEWSTAANQIFDDARQ